MKEPLTFLRDLKDNPPPPVVHLAGEDLFIRETIRNRVISAWSEGGNGATVDRLAGTDGAAALPGAMGAGSLFATRKVIILADPPPSPKASKKAAVPLASLGKNQLASLQKSIGEMPSATHRLILETGTLKATSQVLKVFAGLGVQVDASPPKGQARQKWIAMLARKKEALLDGELEAAMTASTVPLSVLAADLEKLALAKQEGEQADLATWKALTQAEPETSIWEIGDALGAGQAGKALESLKNLEEAGANINQIIPALLSWNQQRLQVKSMETAGTGSPEGMHPFVLKKIKAQVERRSLAQLRREQRGLCYLDRCMKQSWENPHTLLEKLLVEFSMGKAKWARR